MTAGKRVITEPDCSTPVCEKSETVNQKNVRNSLQHITHAIRTSHSFFTFTYDFMSDIGMDTEGGMTCAF